MTSLLRQCRLQNLEECEGISQLFKDLKLIIRYFSRKDTNL